MRTNQHVEIWEDAERVPEYSDLHHEVRAIVGRGDRVAPEDFDRASEDFPYPVVRRVSLPVLGCEVVYSHDHDGDLEIELVRYGVVAV